MKKIGLFLIIVFVFIGCKKNSTTTDTTSIVGKWKMENANTVFYYNSTEVARTVYTSLTIDTVVYKSDGTFTTNIISTNNNISTPTSGNYTLTNSNTNLHLFAQNFTQDQTITTLNSTTLILSDVAINTLPLQTAPINGTNKTFNGVKAYTTYSKQ